MTRSFRLYSPLAERSSVVGASCGGRKIEKTELNVKIQKPPAVVSTVQFR